MTDEYFDDSGLIKPDSVVVENGLKVETFTIDLPDDLFSNKEDEANYAVYYARENAVTWVNICNWTAVETSPHVWAVKRTSNAK